MKKYIFDYNTVTNVIDDCLAEILNFYAISEKENTIKCKMNESTYNTFCSILASNLNFFETNQIHQIKTYKSLFCSVEVEFVIDKNIEKNYMEINLYKKIEQIVNNKIFRQEIIIK